MTCERHTRYRAHGTERGCLRGTGTAPDRGPQTRSRGRAQGSGVAETHDWHERCSRCTRPRISQMWHTEGRACNLLAGPVLPRAQVDEEACRIPNSISLRSGLEMEAAKSGFFSAEFTFSSLLWDAAVLGQVLLPSELPKTDSCHVHRRSSVPVFR